MHTFEQKPSLLKDFGQLTAVVQDLSKSRLPCIQLSQAILNSHFHSTYSLVTSCLSQLYQVSTPFNMGSSHRCTELKSNFAATLAGIQS